MPNTELEEALRDFVRVAEQFQEALVEYARLKSRVNSKPLDELSERIVNNIKMLDTEDA